MLNTYAQPITTKEWRESDNPALFERHKTEVEALFEVTDNALAKGAVFAVKATPLGISREGALPRYTFAYDGRSLQDVLEEVSSLKGGVDWYRQPENEALCAVAHGNIVHNLEAGRRSEEQELVLFQEVLDDSDRALILNEIESVDSLDEVSKLAEEIFESLARQSKVAREAFSAVAAARHRMTE